MFFPKNVSLTCKVKDFWFLILKSFTLPSLPMCFKKKLKHIWGTRCDLTCPHAVTLELSLGSGNTPFTSSRVPRLRRSPSTLWVPASLLPLWQLPGACRQQLSGRQTDRPAEPAPSWSLPTCSFPLRPSGLARWAQPRPRWSGLWWRRSVMRDRGEPQTTETV